ncbi:MAG TPA: FAD-binding oxidoreductase [Candidatus Nanopelagicaceae bacterium]
MNMPSEQTQSAGWGRSIHSDSTTSKPLSLDELQQEVLNQRDSRGVLAFGLRRSYGDSALNIGGLSIDMENFSEIAIYPDTQSVTIGAGVSIRTLEKAAREHQLFPPVVPGTGFVTIGGAIAADIHGKSHHLTGSFSSCVTRIRLLYSDGEVRDIFPDGPTSPHFWATVGGLGLTGVILEADLRLVQIESPSVSVEETRADDLGSMLAMLKAADGQFQHTVAWIDLSGDFRGRGIVSKGNYFEGSFKENMRLKKPRSKESPQLRFPEIGNHSLINRHSVRAFNEMWFRKPLAHGLSSLESFMHPLDRIQNWNRIYGNTGFLQYQFVVPDENEDFLEHVLGKMKEIGAASFLGVLKRFGKGSLGHLSFPAPGWTLALDIPTKVENLERTLNELDEQLCVRGGRIYLIKDARLRPEFLPIMYPRLDEWRNIRSDMDPRGLWQSDQARRLRIC